MSEEESKDITKEETEIYSKKIKQKLLPKLVLKKDESQERIISKEIKSNEEKEDLGEEQEDLGQEQEDLGQEQEDLGQEQEDLGQEQEVLGQEQEEIDEEQVDLSKEDSKLLTEEAEIIDSQREEINCPVNRKNLVGKWKTSFPANTLEIYYTCEIAICTYELILYIIKDYLPELRNLTLTALKNELVIIYKNYIKYLPLLFKILENQGKGSLIRMVKNGEINFDDLLLSENYYITNLDIALIAIYYNIPLIFLSSTLLQENNKSFMIINSTNNVDYYFIRTPGIRTEGFPVQRLFFYENALINIRDLKEKFKVDIEKMTELDFFEDYIKTFEKKKKPRLVLVEKKESE